MLSAEKKIVLIHDYQKDAVSDKVIHIDFFETSAKEEVEVKIPLIVPYKEASKK